MNYTTFSEYCAETRDSDACCHKIRIYMALALYTLIHHGGWVSAKQLCKETRIPYSYIAMALRKLQRYGLVERVYVPGVHGIASLWRVRDDILNGYGKKNVLDALMKHIKMCIEYSVAGAMQFSETA
uniref:HTH marR-type domain-containing protein n=1 Tax=Ignisphaera aggregans TaxID=334771 RepID=A0A7J2U653_9CREN